MSINFISTEISGFYGYMISNQMLSHLSSGDKDDISYFNFIKELQNNICQGHINNIEQLINFTTEMFPDRAEKVETFCKNCRQKLNEYSSFYHGHLTDISQYQQALEQSKNDENKGYCEEISKLYNFFNIDKSVKCYGILAPVPQKKMDGCAAGSSFVMFYDTQKDSSQTYIGESLLQEKKVATPLHETTHILFDKSQIKKDLKEHKGKGAEKLLSSLDKYFSANPDSRGRNSFLAIDEALAACSSALVNSKYKPRNDTDEFYHGFDAANKLAKSIYPLFCSYIKQGKTMDDTFLEQAADRFEEQQNKETNTIENRIQKIKENSLFLMVED